MDDFVTDLYNEMQPSMYRRVVIPVAKTRDKEMHGANDNARVMVTCYCTTMQRIMDMSM